MRAERLVRSLGIFCGCPDFEVRGISSNSKQIKQDFIFVAIKGFSDDGSRFIEEAVERGAKAIVYSGVPLPALRMKEAGGRSLSGEGVFFIEVEDARKALAGLAVEFYGNPSLKVKVVGITGTNGKTTVSYLIEAILKEARLLSAVIGTVNYRYNKYLVPAGNTTPAPVELQEMLAGMSREGVGYALIEVSSHALDQGRVDGVNFHSAIFTNLSQDHLDYHKDMKEYFNAKAGLFRRISSPAFAVVNNDDAYAAEIKKAASVSVVGFGIDNQAEVSAKNINLKFSHTEFSLSVPGEELVFKIPLVGRHNVYNVLASAAWAYGAGISLSVVRSALEKPVSLPGRLERIDCARGFAVFIDYAHTEDALKNVISFLRETAGGKIIVVFGCGGLRDKGKRPKMGRAATELSDFAIITNDNPRLEHPQDIIEEIRKGITKTNYSIIPDRSEAIKEALLMAGRGDVVLIAGKGHEEYQIINGTRVYFSDREEVKKCLESMNC